MRTSSANPILDEALNSASEAAAEKAGTVRRPVLASIGVPVPEFDPLALLQSEPDPVCGWWAQPGFDAAGTGIAVTHERRGPARLADLGKALAGTFEEGTFEGRGPIAFAGASFATSNPGGDWSAFPQAAGWIPETCAIRDADGTWLVVATMVNPGEPKDAAREHLAALFGEAGARLKNAAAAEAGDSFTSGEFAPDNERWTANVDEALEKIRGGGLQKVVLARRLRITGAQAAAWKLAEQLTELCPQAFRYGVKRGDAAFLGASPELLVQLDGDEVRALPAAGTVASSAPDDSELSADKTQREHQFVAQAVADTLRLWCDDVRASEPRVIAAGPVRHLATDVQGRLSRPAHILELAGALHPTPAVCGVPLHRASEFIRDHEGFDRGWYAGPVGVVHPDGSGTFAVALRCALLTPAGVDCYAGAGIVEGSDADSEREEVAMKMQAVGAALDASPA